MLSSEDLALLETIEAEFDLVEARAALADPSNQGPQVAWEALKAELGL